MLEVSESAGGRPVSHQPRSPARPADGRPGLARIIADHPGARQVGGQHPERLVRGVPLDHRGDQVGRERVRPAGGVEPRREVDVVDLHLAQPHAGDGGVADHPATRRTFEGLGPVLVREVLDGVDDQGGAGHEAVPEPGPVGGRQLLDVPGAFLSERYMVVGSPWTRPSRTPASPSALRARCATTCARVQSGSPLGAPRASSSRPSTVRTRRWVASGSSAKAPWGSRSDPCPDPSSGLMGPS